MSRTDSGGVTFDSTRRLSTAEPTWLHAARPLGAIHSKLKPAMPASSRTRSFNPERFPHPRLRGYCAALTLTLGVFSNGRY